MRVAARPTRRYLWGMFRWGITLTLALVVWGCGDDAPPTDVDGGVTLCAADEDCDDGTFCNGAERCEPDSPSASRRGCVPGPPPCMASQVCDESELVCRTRCELEPDADGDGAVAAACGGDDCDDADANRYPGNAEVCDGAGHDEDCDDTTFGDRDRDGDGAIDARCCNGDVCGTDCDDRRAAIVPGAAEVCDGRDDDCDGVADEGVTVAGFDDRDRDLHGDPDSPRDACPDTVGFSVEGDDCDDADPARHGAQPELCDGVDNDCDGTTDENPRAVSWYADLDGDGFGDAAGGVVTSCAPVANHSLLPTDCDDTRRGVNPGAGETCNGLDDDCNGIADYDLGPRGFEDDDGDGEIDAACPGVGTDCDDDDPLVGAGAIELCMDGIDDDCDGSIDESMEDLAWGVDLDLDGYAGDDDVVINCARVEGRTYRTGDCDDSSAEIRPGALERCDGVDEDCDGSFDEGTARAAFYEDRDADGVGAGEIVLACVAPPGHVQTGDDCDDADADIRFAVARYRDVDGDGVGAMLDGTTCGDPGPGYSTAGGDCNDDAIAVGSCDGLEGAEATCTAGACVIDRCEGTRVDCDGLAHNGCESDPETDAFSCGGCAMPACGLGAPCVDGGCDESIVSLAVGEAGCVVRASGATVCWGQAMWSGTTQPELRDDLAGATAVFQGLSGNTCVTRAVGAPVCVGRNTAVGLMGAGASDTRVIDPAEPILVSDAVEAQIGSQFGCARRASGQVLCWGQGTSGQLGHHRSESSVDPVVVALPAPALQLAAGEFHSCVVLDDGSAEDGGPVRCWGYGIYGELGSGTTSHSNRAVAAVGVDDAVQVVVGLYHTCARHADGGVSCWGYNPSGQLGTGDTMRRTTPTRVDGLTDVVDLGAGRDTSCALLGSGRVRCWGGDNNHQLGNGDPIENSTVPVDVAGPADYVAIELGSFTGCGVTRDDRVRCWGYGHGFRLGTGDPSNAPVPMEVVRLAP